MTEPPLERRALARQLTQAGSFGLPLELVAQARRRLVTTLYLALFGGLLSLIVRVSLALSEPGVGQGQWLGVTYAVLIVSVSGLFLGLSRLKSGRPGFALELGLVFEVVLGYTITLGNTAYEVARHGHPPFLTWTAPLMVVFPLLVPSPPRVTLIAAIVTGSSSPAAVLLLAALGKLDATVGTYAEACVSPIAATVIAYFGSRVVYGLSLDYAAAKQLGSYTLTTRLGGGGMGEVWRAEHQLLARPAAVKLVRRDSVKNLRGSAGALLERFEREAQITALLRSPHTVQLYDFGIADDGSFFYVMELLEGLDLDSFVVEHGPMPAERVVYVLRQVCASLGEAHEMGLVHRDIKPANLYLCRYGLISDFVKVLDFGLVKAPQAPAGDGQSGLTSESAINGTPEFMAPEQASGEAPVGPYTDVYSLACVAFWLLTGRLVFEGETPIAILARHISTPPPAASDRAPGPVPQALDRLLYDCLEKDPALRLQDMRSFEQRLELIRFESPWDEERARAWWERNVPALAASRPSVPLSSPFRRARKTGAA